MLWYTWGIHLKCAGPKSEASEVAPRYWYACAKVLAEGLLRDYAENMGKVLRLGAVYGTHCTNLIGYMLQAIMDGRLFRADAPPQCRWNFVYVDNVYEWILKSIFMEESSGVINLTSSNNPTSLELYMAMKEAVPAFHYEMEEQEQYFEYDKWYEGSKRERYLGKEFLFFGYYRLKNGSSVL